MIPFVLATRADEVSISGLDSLIEDSWWHDVDQSRFGGYNAYHSTVMSIFTNGPRVEGYLLDDRHNPVGMVFMQRTMDIHYGLAATPITVYLHTEYRQNRKAVRALAKLQKEVVKRLGCEQYYTVQHISNTKAVHTLRSL